MAARLCGPGAATGARNGELRGLEWHDLDLEAGTIRFRQALSSVDQQQPRTRTAEGHRARPRLLHIEPGEPPRTVELDLVLRTQWGTPLRPNHASRCFRTFAEAAGIAAHPHLRRHSLASALAAAKEPASVIAEQPRHAESGTLAGRTYIHRLPQTAPRLARRIQAVYGSAARQARTDDRK